MGISYYLYKPINHERYDLGKGSWRDVDFSPDFIYESLMDNLNYNYSNQEGIDYTAWVAKDLIRWIGSDQVVVYSEDGFEDLVVDKVSIIPQRHDMSWREKNFPITGSRFK